MIARAPHTVFAITWAVLMLGSGVFGVIGMRYPWWSLGWLLLILLVEIVAVLYPGDLRTTLSEITTWTNRKLSKHRAPLRGWNTLVAIQAAVLGWHVGTMMVGFGGPTVIPLAIIVGGLFARGQHAHWLSPDVHG